jgi:hypothetical protein
MSACPVPFRLFHFSFLVTVSLRVTKTVCTNQLIHVLSYRDRKGKKGRKYNEGGGTNQLERVNQSEEIAYLAVLVIRDKMTLETGLILSV